MFVLLGVCAVLVLIGIPSAAEGALWGWILGILGIVGTIGLVVISVRGQRGERPSYDDFLIGVFLFCVALGILIGIPVGMEAHSFWFGLLASLAGLAAGYVVGILGGMWLQYLGWIAVVINMVAGLGAIILERDGADNAGRPGILKDLRG